jgi:hypothetical protein
MGLTIHYELHANTRSQREARRLVEQLRKKALDLPFAKVGEVVEVAGEACDCERYNRDDLRYWLVGEAGQYVDRGGIHYHVEPKHVVAFRTCPGDGCENADFGLAIYPGILAVQDPRTGRDRRLRTGFSGWCWGAFCKTVYASRFGVENFVRCHLSVVAMLDHAHKLGMLAAVKDEGGFLDGRDLVALVQQVGEWNDGMAGMAAQMKDMFDDDIFMPTAQLQGGKA